MSLASRLKLSFPSTNQLIISILIAGLGWISGQALSRIDQDLRIMYTEYTLGAADLAHISADVIRYRNTIIRSLEAADRKTFERITESLPSQRARIQHAVDRYAAAGLRVSRSGRSEEKDILAVRESLDQYFTSRATPSIFWRRNGMPELHKRQPSCGAKPKSMLPITADRR